MPHRHRTGSKCSAVSPKVAPARSVPRQQPIPPLPCSGRRPNAHLSLPLPQLPAPRSPAHIHSTHTGS